MEVRDVARLEREVRRVEIGKDLHQCCAVGWVTTSCERATGRLRAARAIILVANMMFVRYRVMFTTGKWTKGGPRSLCNPKHPSSSGTNSN